MEPVRQLPAYMNTAPSRAISTICHSGGRAKIAGFLRGGPDSVLVKFMEHCCWTKWHWNRLFSEHFNSPLSVNNFTTTIHPSIIWAIKNHSSKRYSIILLQEINIIQSDGIKKFHTADYLGAIAKLQQATTGFVIVCRCVFPWNKSAPTGRIVVEFYIWLSFENLLRKWKTCWNMTIITGILCEGLQTFMKTSRRNVLRMRKSSDRSCREIQNTILCSIYIYIYIYLKVVADYEILRKSIVGPDRP